MACAATHPCMMAIPYRLMIVITTLGFSNYCFIRVVISPWRTDYNLVDFTVQFTKTTTKESITGLSMGWCNLIDPADYELGCSNRANNQHRSSLLAKKTKFNPFKPNYDYYTQTLETVEAL